MMMMDLPLTTTSRLMRRERFPGEYEIYKAGLEWDLVDPIVIEDHQDIRSGDRWKELVRPFRHQVTNLITFCRRLPVTLLADDVGLGKTISAGLIVSELFERGRLSSFLVVCPKILGPQWKEELESKFGIASKVATGRELITVQPEHGQAIITTYNSARMYLDKVPVDRFQMLILDEAHKLRNLFGVPNPPKVATKFRQALEERRFNFVLMLTATPIHNRLWDLYSLVDLLCVARGHSNPFGTPTQFGKKYIADDQVMARKLRPDSQEDFRSVVYGYMSRVRRGDAELYFPTREVNMTRVEPSRGELELITMIAKPIQELDALTQIGILKALVSSPEAVAKQLENMSGKGTIPHELALAVRAHVRTMPVTSKLNGLDLLVQKLRQTNPQNWRVVVFTTRLETQAAIEDFLARKGVRVGVINGSTGLRNQETIGTFKQDPPLLNVIISTEAGSEGVNLQAANVLVNYDLPWNPMIVEQRIGRVQRLGSRHEHVVIHNIVLAGTFEDYIVGKLLEKLQMASHAIGDIESLLQASGISDEDDDGDFEHVILRMVLASLAGKDMKRDAAMQVESITRAEADLQRERENIDTLLGNVSTGDQGPRTPVQPPIERSMDYRSFVAAAHNLLGNTVINHSDNECVVERQGVRDTMYFSREAAEGNRGYLLVPGSPEFARLVDQIVATGVHRIEDVDQNIERATLSTARAWAEQFGATPQSMRVNSVERLFEGRALARVRARVQHDSFERLVEVDCPAYLSNVIAGRSGMEPLAEIIGASDETGATAQAIAAAAQVDPVVQEFCRFYLERRELEVRAAGADVRRAAKLREEFTPRLEVDVSALDGTVRRAVNATIRYTIADAVYESGLSIDPANGALYDAPHVAQCSVSGGSFPDDCIETCAVSGAKALRHLLIQSEVSGRLCLAAHATRCTVTGRTIVKDEAVASAITGASIALESVSRSQVSGLPAEPTLMGSCAFTGATALPNELGASQVSGKSYRSDQMAMSAVSGRAGHRSEFVECAQTHDLIASDEAEVCEITGRTVRRGLLVTCEVSGKRAMSSELAVCTVTKKRAVRSLLASSSVSEAFVLASEAIRSSSGQACLPSETIVCGWSSVASHPADIVQCEFTKLPIRREYYSTQHRALQALSELLDGVRHHGPNPTCGPRQNAASSAHCMERSASSRPPRRPQMDGALRYVVKYARCWDLSEQQQVPSIR